MNVSLQQYIQSRMENLVSSVINTLGEDALVLKKIPKNTTLLNKDEISKHVYFVKSGSLRNFIYDKNGNDITTWFAFENNVTLAPASFFAQIPTFEMIQTIETSEIYFMHLENVLHRFKTELELNQIIRYLLEMHIMQMSNRMQSLQGKFAEERYHDLIVDFPHIIQRVPLSYIASYIGISLETLSRIRHGKKNNT